jgi:ATP-dependent RNA helicase DDX5/DBP2
MPQGKLNTLLATDVAARGIHIKNIQYVVNYDFPGTLEQYCHRIGRAGRAGCPGRAYSLLTRNMGPLVPGLVLLLERGGQTVEPNLRSLAADVAMNMSMPDENEAGEGDEQEE